MNRLHVLIATSDVENGDAVAEAVSVTGPSNVLRASDTKEIRRILQEALVDVLVVDLTQPENSGQSGDSVDLILAVRQDLPHTSVVVLTDQTLQQHDREAIKLGVEGFLVKPVQAEHAQFQFAHVREMRRLREQNAHLRQAASQGSGMDQILGISHEMKQVFNLITRAARSQAPVAIYGESGTGKELIARAIHRNSPRKEGPFISINPSAIPETLLESELFGHVRGAFTGATRDRVGYIEAAQGGTLFLDEIGDLPLSFQGKFLRVLQEKVLQRVGSTRSVPVSFRLISATNRDMPAELDEGRFRPDLFYRIHVLPIHVPPLRDRPGDISLLAEHFLAKYVAELGHPIPGFAPGSLEILLKHPWPGNVRELDNVIHQLVAMKSDSSAVTAADMTLLSSHGQLDKPQDSPTGSTPDSKRVMPTTIQPLNEHVRQYVRWVYESLGQNKAHTARVLEIDRTTLYRKLRGE